MSALMDLLQALQWIRTKARDALSRHDAGQVRSLLRQMEDVAEGALDEARSSGLAEQAEREMLDNIMAPWREWEFGREMSPGVTWFDLGEHPDNHSGLRLSPERNGRVPDRWRKKDGWYPEFDERDGQQVDWARAVVVHPQGFQPNVVETAERLVEHTDPEGYRRFKQGGRALDL